MLWDVMLGLAACVAALVFGVLLAKKQARAFVGQAQGDLPAVNFFDYGDMRFLHLGSPAVQGSMRISQPFDIHLEYVQRMMGWLLFADLDRVAQGHAMQLGLGAAALTKFCYHHVAMQTTAIELNPKVIEACRHAFHLPKDDAKLRVVQANAAEVVASDTWRGKIDALQVDLYDAEAARPVLDSAEFYTHCHQTLTPSGCMVVNIFGRAANVQESVTQIANVFGETAVWVFKPTPAGNVVVLALRTPALVDPERLRSQAQRIESRWPLPATAWLPLMTPLRSARG
jgi:spermidine synthase